MNQTLVSYLSQYEFFDTLLAVFGKNEGLLAFTIYLVFAGIIVGLCATIGGLGTYAERKISADIQQRIGPNRVGPYGILQFLADGVKMITKEDIMPFTADKFLFYLAPMLALIGVFSTLAVLPWSNGLIMADLNVGIFYLIAISSLVGVSVFLGGYASNSKWSMLGGMRGASQIISYEILKNSTLKPAWMRLFSVYGSNDDRDWVLTKAFSSIMKNKKIVFGSCRQLWSLTHVEDVANATRMIIEKEFIGELNVSDLTVEPLKNHLLLLQQLMGKDDLLFFEENDIVERALIRKPGEIEKLGWKAQVSTTAGFKRMINEQL
jgi:hypothetical protein